MYLHTPLAPEDYEYTRIPMKLLPEHTIECSRMFEMRYFYACDQVDKKYFTVYWHPGAENLGDYASKHHEAAHHKLVRPIYLHEVNSPRVLTRALTPQQVRKLGVGKTPSKRGRSSQGGTSTGRSYTPPLTAVAAHAFAGPAYTPVHYGWEQITA